MATTEINLETRLPYAKFDHLDTRARQAHFHYQPDWRWEYVGLLKVGEHGKAERLRERVRKDRNNGND